MVSLKRSFQIMRSSILSAIMTIISQKPMSPLVIPLSKKTAPLTTILTKCVCQPRVRYLSAVMRLSSRRYPASMVWVTRKVISKCCCMWWWAIKSIVLLRLSAWLKCNIRVTSWTLGVVRIACAVSCWISILLNLSSWRYVCICLMMKWRKSLGLTL